jgi:hypothetical protein
MFADTDISVAHSIANEYPDKFRDVKPKDLAYIFQKFKDEIPEGSTFQWSNFGIYNYIGLIRFPNNPVPQRVLVLSSPENPDSVEKTEEDYKGLKLVADRFQIFKSQGKISADATLPVAETLGIVEGKEGLVAMLNKFVGHEGFGSEETNQIIIPNPYGRNWLRWVVHLTPTNGFLGHEWDDENFLTSNLRIKAAKEIVFYHDNADTSENIAVAHVSTLTQIWLLSRRLPLEYSATSGCGVLVNHQINPLDQDVESAPFDIRLISLRGGLPKRDLSYEEFYIFLSEKRDKPYLTTPADRGIEITFPSDRFYGYYGGEERFLFTDSQITDGIELGLKKLFGPQYKNNIFWKEL